MIYLDYNSTTPIHPNVLEAMMPYLTTDWGNPSSKYKFGSKLLKTIENARHSVAELVGANPSEIIFTSCATESNNTALNSAIRAQPNRKHIITSVVEHSSVLNYCKYLEKDGFTVTYLPVDREGLINISDLKNTISVETALVSLMWANNETGVISPIRKISEICNEYGVPFHCDAVQAVGKLSINFKEVGLDYLSLSGHKIGSPKGVGVLVAKDSNKFFSTIHGGKQENQRRGGTENVPGIIGLGIACNIALKNMNEQWDRIDSLRINFEKQILDRIKGSYINGGNAPRLPNTTNAGIDGIDNDGAVIFLEQAGILTSTGSACLENSQTPSHVIFAMTKSHSQANECIRFSLGLETTKENLETTIERLNAYIDLTN